MGFCTDSEFAAEIPAAVGLKLIESNLINWQPGSMFPKLAVSPTARFGARILGGLGLETKVMQLCVEVATRLNQQVDNGKVNCNGGACWR